MYRLCQTLEKSFWALLLRLFLPFYEPSFSQTLHTLSSHFLKNERSYIISTLAQIFYSKLIDIIFYKPMLRKDLFWRHLFVFLFTQLKTFKSGFIKKLHKHYRYLMLLHSDSRQIEHMKTGPARELMQCLTLYMSTTMCIKTVRPRLEIYWMHTQLSSLCEWKRTL